MSTRDQKKRKRDDDPEADVAQPRKARVLEQNGASEKKSGLTRQEKSERRSKKANKTKRVGAGEKRTSLGKPKKVKEDVVKLLADAPGDDTLANGADFISLTGSSAVPPTKKIAASTKKNVASPKKKVAKIKNNTPGSTQDPAKTAARFIVFVGNLPYETTTQQIQDHFVKLAPFNVRHSTEKSTGRSRGFAFLEFEGYDKMKTCLKLYHHSIFDPSAAKSDGAGVDNVAAQQAGNKKKARRINVELTAGGGGAKSEGRKEKIKTKNEKLEEKRKRQRDAERSEQEKAARDKRMNPATGANANGADTGHDNRGSIHPSRLNRVQH